ncbi:hypothetical protein [Anaerotignum sp.]|uniref:hypothetical protein n=1 Tax=Anaerotignum sp. TaxID=2039241 RepID=UPI00373576A1
MKKKFCKVLSLTVVMSLMTAVPAFAGEYQESRFDAVIHGQSVKEHGGKTVEIDGQIYVPLRTTFEMLEKNVEYWKDSRRVFVNEAVEPSNSEFAFKQPYHLIASIPQERIFLYGLQPRGVVVSFDGDASYIDADYATPQRILPEIAYGDYTGDDIKEIAVSFNTDSGTGVDVDTLHILTTDGKEPYVFEDHVFDHAVFQNLFDQEIQTEIKNNTITYKINEKKERQFKLDLPEGKEIKALQVGNLIDFDVAKSNILFSVSLGAVYEGVPEGKVFGYLTGEIVFDGTQFSVRNLDMISEEAAEMNTELKAVAQELLERDLEIEFIFNAGLQGDSEYSYQCSLIWEETGQKYFSAVSDTYKTVADLEKLLRRTYSSEERIQHFMQSDVYSEEPYFKEVDGQLYVNMNNGGKGMPIIVDFNSVQVNQISPTKADITFDFDEFDYKTKLAKTSMTLMDGTWYLDQGVYEVAEIA